LGGGDVRGVGDCDVASPDAGVIGNDTPVEAHPHSCEVSCDHDVAADRSGVDRVVVGVDAHVVVAAEPDWSSPGSPDTRGVVMHIMPLERRGLSWRR
jgi:hypothetical protein